MKELFNNSFRKAFEEGEGAPSMMVVTLEGLRVIYPDLNMMGILMIWEKMEPFDDEGYLRVFKL